MLIELLTVMKFIVKWFHLMFFMAVFRGLMLNVLLESLILNDLSSYED